MTFKKILTATVFVAMIMAFVIAWFRVIAADTKQIKAENDSRNQAAAEMVVSAEKQLQPGIEQKLEQAGMSSDVTLIVKKPVNAQNKPFSPELLHPLPLLQDASDDGYFDHATGKRFSPRMSGGVVPYDFGQFYINRITLEKYVDLWSRKLRLEGHDKPEQCRIFSDSSRAVISGPECSRKYSYIEAHADIDGVVSAIIVNGDCDRTGHDTKTMNDYLNKRYNNIRVRDMTPEMKAVAKMHNDLCEAMIALMDGKYKCTNDWYEYNNFILLYNTSEYDGKRREQFLYSSAQHFISHEQQLVKRRLAVIRQELSRKFKRMSVSTDKK